MQSLVCVPTILHVEQTISEVLHNTGDFRLQTKVIGTEVGMKRRWNGMLKEENRCRSNYRHEGHPETFGDR